jgi:hypothetical protein
MKISVMQSHDITTILQRFEVVSSDLGFTGHTDEPPFVILGTTNRAFQATINLYFNRAEGQENDYQRVILEHWVQIDMTRTAKSPVVGDEQIVDIELDRRTTILPKKADYPPVTSRVHWESKGDSSESSTQIIRYEDSTIGPLLLRALLKSLTRLRRYPAKTSP